MMQDYILPSLTCNESLDHLVLCINIAHRRKDCHLLSVIAELKLYDARLYLPSVTCNESLDHLVLFINIGCNTLVVLFLWSSCFLVLFFK